MAKEKSYEGNYFEKPGMDAMKLWLSQLGINNLKTNKSQKKIDRLWQMINNHHASMYGTGSSDDDIKYAEYLKSQLTPSKRFQSGIPVDLTEIKLWLAELAICEFKECANISAAKEKAKRLMFWLEMSKDLIRTRHLEVLGKYTGGRMFTDGFSP